MFRGLATRSSGAPPPSARIQCTLFGTFADAENVMRSPSGVHDGVVLRPALANRLNVPRSNPYNQMPRSRPIVLTASRLPSGDRRIVRKSWGGMGSGSPLPARSSIMTS
jgi:hypothetical protein